MKGLGLILLFVLITYSTNSQEPGRSFLLTERLSPKKLKSDITYLFDRIEAIHINPYTVASRQVIYDQIKHAKKQLRKASTPADFYRIVAPIVVNLKDGHTGLGISDATLFIMERAFPYKVKFSQDNSALIVTENHGDTLKLPLGTKIELINSIPARTIIKNILNYISGEKESFRYAVSEAIFPTLLFWVYGFDGNFKVAYKEVNGINRTINIPGITAKVYESKFSFNLSSHSKNYCLSIYDTLNTALIDFNAFIDIKAFRSFLDSSFREIHQREIENLIIDIRGNDGGHSELGNELLKYIVSVPFRQHDNLVVKISEEVKKEYDYKQKPGEIFQVQSGSKQLILPYDSLKRFGGKIDLLTDNYVFSSAADFAWCFKHYKIGQVIGEETGGLGVSYGETILTRLPNTKISFRVSHKKFYCIGATDINIHGVFPDIEMRDDPTTLIDEVISYTLQIIEDR